ncbi:hypothetical protein, partial [Arthrobacter sp. CAN_A2]|uniref:hypothetical protein n=1 Tax=Arthrobacter sp. CAN_A2 TaxID=2787718 RepID=UPI002FF2E664
RNDTEPILETLDRRKPISYRIDAGLLTGAQPGELPGEFFLHRVWLYFCGGCFDEGCGGISVSVQVGTDQVVWSEFCHDGPPSTENELDEFQEEDRVTHVGPLVFDRGEYEAALDDVGDQLGRSYLRHWLSTAPLTCTST